MTAGVVLARLAPVGDLSFFTATEDATATVLCNLLLAQDCDPRIPVVSLIDARLAAGETDGWGYEDMPEDSQAWRDTLADLDADARAAHGTGFAALDRAAAAAMVQDVFDRSTRGGDFHGRAANHVWSLWTRYATTAFYSHLWAWNEIGFGGPAYPRGYKNVGIDARERWEVARPRRHRPAGVRPTGPAGDRRARPAHRLPARAARAHDGPPRRVATRAGGSAVTESRFSYRSLRERNDSAWLIPNDGSRVNHQLRADMRHFDDTDEVDLVVIGAGAGGSVLTQRLARHG